MAPHRKHFYRKQENQMRLLHVIYDFIEAHHYSPSIREMMDQMSTIDGGPCRSSSVVRFWVKGLQAVGYVDFEVNIARSVSITPEGLTALHVKTDSLTCPYCHRSFSPEKARRSIMRDLLPFNPTVPA